MAAEIKSFSTPSSKDPLKLTLANKLEGHQDIVNMAFILREEEGGVISISDDKTVRIWLKRENGNYWPSVCHIMPAPASAMDLDQDSRRLFVGTELGGITEFTIADDLNKLTSERSYPAHQMRVTAITYVSALNVLLSISKDKSFHYYCTLSGRKLGEFIVPAPATSLQFDIQSKHVFIGDASGQISMLKIESNGVRPINTLKGHTNAVKSILWDPVKQMLFSASSDSSIICWDIGGKKGTIYELQGHKEKVTSLVYAQASQRLISGGSDSLIVSWYMNIKRKETPEWAESDFCQRCSRPFFWNFKAMYDQKTIGLRQHHCRKCGKATCDNCSAKRSTLPLLGHESPVRVCDECYSVLTDSDRVSLAAFYDAKHAVTHLDLDENRSLLLSSGTDRVIKLWDITEMLQRTAP